MTEHTRIRASEFVKSHKIGDKVYTYPFGAWEGGLCRVIEFHPDPRAPEIVMQVRRILGDGEEIGVFDYEWVSER